MSNLLISEIGKATLTCVLTCLACLVIIFALWLAMAHIIHKVVFSRQDRVKNYKYYSAENFGLLTEPLEVTLRGEQLHSVIYSSKPLLQCEKVVIFAHGFGAGAASYTTEIAHFARLGYAVVATDAYGCDNSPGKSIIGFYAGAEAVIATYIAVKKDERLSSKKVVLVGHSWGAYSVLCASKKIGAEGVVAISAFNKPAECVCDQLGNLSKSNKFLAALLHPAFYISNFFRFGINGNKSAAKVVYSTGAKYLLIHGQKDKVVPLKHSAAQKAVGVNVTKLILEDKKHNPYNTVAAEQKLKELSSGHSFQSEKEEEEYLKKFDWTAATEEDSSVMQKIDGFIKSV